MVGNSLLATSWKKGEGHFEDHLEKWIDENGERVFWPAYTSDEDFDLDEGLSEYVFVELLKCPPRDR